MVTVPRSRYSLVTSYRPLSYFLAITFLVGALWSWKIRELSILIINFYAIARTVQTVVQICTRTVYVPNLYASYVHHQHRCMFTHPSQFPGFRSLFANASPPRIKLEVSVHPQLELPHWQPVNHNITLASRTSYYADACSEYKASHPQNELDTSQRVARISSNS